MPNEITTYNLKDKIKERHEAVYDKYVTSAFKQVEKVVFEAVDKGFAEVAIPFKGPISNSNSELSASINCIQKVLRINPNSFVDVVRDNFQLDKSTVYFKDLGSFGDTYFHLVIDWSELDAE